MIDKEPDWHVIFQQGNYIVGFNRGRKDGFAIVLPAEIVGDILCTGLFGDAALDIGKKMVTEHIEHIALQRVEQLFSDE